MKTNFTSKIVSKIVLLLFLNIQAAYPVESEGIIDTQEITATTDIVASQDPALALTPIQTQMENIKVIQEISAMPNIADKIKGLYELMQQALDQDFDAETQRQFATILVQIFNEARTTQSYMAQLLQASTQTSLLNATQQAYVKTNMIPLAGPVATATPATTVATATEEVAPTPEAVPAVATAKKKKISLKDWLVKFEVKAWVKKEIAKYGADKWQALTNKQKRDLIKQWQKLQPKKKKATKTTAKKVKKAKKKKTTKPALKPATKTKKKATKKKTTKKKAKKKKTAELPSLPLA
ncbi:MAG: hypothetical protein V1855_02395 [bacterium]